jgi:hypothetical protein
LYVCASYSYALLSEALTWSANHHNPASTAAYRLQTASDQQTPQL